MKRKTIQIIILTMFSIYGIIAILISFPFSPFLNTPIPLRDFFPANYRMFVRPAKVYSTLEFVYYNKGENDSMKVDFSTDLKNRLKEEFPFNANSFYYCRALLLYAQKIDYFNNINDYTEKYPEAKLDYRNQAVYKEVKERIPYYKSGLYKLSKKIQQENSALNFKNVIIRLKAHNILPKYDHAYYKEYEYIYSLPNIRTVIELKE
ncbi:MAG: hypothetical protein ACK5MD_04750 [Flavobacteriales bacterium]